MSYKLGVITGLLSCFVVGSALSYEGLAKDYATCTSGQGAKVVSACSRLIKNAQKENSTIGMFYALRASANKDKAQNCTDAKKAKQLIDDPNLSDALNELEKQNC